MFKGVDFHRVTIKTVHLSQSSFYLAQGPIYFYRDPIQWGYGSFHLFIYINLL